MKMYLISQYHQNKFFSFLKIALKKLFYKI